MTTSPDDRTSDHVPSSVATTPTDTTTAESSVTLPDGERFGPFVLLEAAGREGPFELTVAWQIGLSRRVVLKRPAVGAPPVIGDWLRAEATAAARVTHPGVVPVVEAGEVDGVPYLAAVADDGESLATRLVRGPVPARIAAGWAAQLVETLFEVHRDGLVHGNIRPEYIHLGRDGRVRLSGFGTVARPPADDAYTPPERTKNQDLTPRADVYGVGVVLWAMLTGGSLDEGYRRLPRDLRLICERCLHRIPQERYGTRQPMVLVLMDLRRFLSGHALRYDDGWSVRAVWRWCWRNMRTLAWIAVVVVALIAGAIWDRVRSDAAWDTLTRSDATTGEYTQAAAYFGSILAWRPHDPETGAAEDLANYRLARNINDKPSRSAPGSTKWSELAALTAALNRTREGRWDEAERQRHATRTADPTELWPRVEWPRRLRAEIDTLLQSPRQTLGLGHRPDVMAFRQWVLAGDGAADWERSPEARRAIPVLVQELGRASDENPSEAHRFEERLLRIDPNWPASPEARAMIPELTLRFARSALWREDAARAVAALLNRLDPNWPRSTETRQAIPRLVDSLAESPERLGTLDTLARIDPEWRGSPECRTAMLHLARQLAAYTPTLAEWSDPTKEPIIRGGFEPTGQQPYHQSHHIQQSRRAVEYLALVGPLPGGLPELTTQLGHPDPEYDAVLAMVVAVLDPDWFATDVGKAEAERLVVRCGDDDRPSREAALAALAYLPLEPTDVARAIAGAVSARLRMATLNERTAWDNALKAFEPTWPECDTGALIGRAVHGLSAPDAVKRTDALRVLRSLGQTAAPAVGLIVPRLTDPVFATDRDDRTSLVVTTLDSLHGNWRTTLTARRVVPRMLAALSADLPLYHTHSHDDFRLRTLRDLVDGIDPTWRSSPDAGRYLPLLAEALRFPPRDDARDPHLVRPYQACESLEWCAWIRYGGSSKRRSTLAPDVVRILASRLDVSMAESEPGRMRPFHTRLISAISSIGPPPDVIPVLVRTYARGDFDRYRWDGTSRHTTFARYLDEVAPGWSNSPLARESLPLWKQRLTRFALEDEHGRIAAELTTLGPTAVPLLPELRRFVVTPNVKSAWAWCQQAGPLLPLLDRLDPDWVWHSDVDSGLLMLREFARTQKLEKFETDELVKILAHIEDRRQNRPRPKP